MAQLPIPASSQFDLTGFLQEATLAPGCTALPAHCGGTLKVNGHLVTVPQETIVILPANALTWQELFAQAPLPYTGSATGMAMADSPAPLTTFEVNVVGNRVTGAPGGDQYIAGLIHISQQGLNSGVGFINFIDYGIGEMRVGGLIGSATTGTRVRINDPTGRYGRIMSPDPRFTVDPDNPTIASGTGFPMCLPRVAPDSAIPDALCPQANRPKDLAGLFLANFTMAAVPGGAQDATKQAPFEVGDYVTFAGTLVKDGAQPTAGPLGTATTYISAHTVSNNIAIYTWPGVNPAYVAIEVALIGTGGLTVIGAGEAAIRTKFEGMTTDPSRNIHLYGVDYDPTTGAESNRDWGTIVPDPGAPVGAVKGRWRFRPPCTVAVPTIRDCTPPAAGTFLPPSREVRAVIEGAWVPGQITPYANGIIAGQYHAPIGEYIFPENVPGSPIVENNFNTIDFLAKGGYTSTGGTRAGILNPWPSNILPSGACVAPLANTGGPYTAVSGGTVNLAGSGTGTAPLAFAWTAPVGGGTFSNALIANPVYTAPVVSVQTTVTLTLVVSNGCGNSTVNPTVTVNPVASPAPTVFPVPPMTVLSGATPVSFVVSSPSLSGLPLTFAVSQSGLPALVNVTVTQLTPTSATVSFTAPTLPVGQVAPSVINLSITATNTANLTSTPELTTLTVRPLPDAISITVAEYRTAKFRLIINATTSVNSPNVILKLQPYVTQAGGLYNPDPAAGGVGNVLLNNGAGLYIIDLVGAPEPACNATNTDPCTATPLQVRSNLLGASPVSRLTRLRL